MNTLAFLFYWMLIASLRASVIVVVVFVARALAKNRLPARWRYALWLPVLAALVLPGIPLLLPLNSSNPEVKSVTPSREVCAVDPGSANPCPSATARNRRSASDCPRRTRCRAKSGALFVRGCAVPRASDCPQP
jgi:hypothetical protein